MSDQTLAFPASAPFAFEPQDRRTRPTTGGILSSLLSLVVVAAALYQARGLDLATIFALVPTSALFWILFAITYLAGPASEWLIFHRLWGVGPAAFGAVVRKLIYNELLVGYLGEVYFYSWARRSLKFVTTPFGAVKDVAVLSAAAGNATTLVFLALAFPFVELLPLHDHAVAIGWSIAFVIGTSLAILLFRGSVFSLDSGELKMVFAVHLLRILVTAIVSAALWHMVLPDVALG